MSVRLSLQTMLAAATMVLLTACAATSSRDDPFEPMNRVSYRVHEVVDGQIVKPMIQAYVDYTPPPIRKGIHNFFGNIDDLFSFINAMLQNKPDKAGHDLGRAVVTAVGVDGDPDSGTCRRGSGGGGHAAVTRTPRPPRRRRPA